MWSRAAAGWIATRGDAHRGRASADMRDDDRCVTRRARRGKLTKVDRNKRRQADFTEAQAKVTVS